MLKTFRQTHWFNRYEFEKNTDFYVSDQNQLLKATWCFKRWFYSYTNRRRQETIQLYFSLTGLLKILFKNADSSCNKICEVFRRKRVRKKIQQQYEKNKIVSHLSKYNFGKTFGKLLAILSNFRFRITRELCSPILNWNKIKTRTKKQGLFVFIWACTNDSFLSLQHNKANSALWCEVSWKKRWQMIS